MARPSIPVLLVGFILIIAGLHLLASVLYLYWFYFWFDLLVHLLGGFWVGLLTLWLVFFTSFADRLSLPTSTHSFLSVGLAAAFVVSVLWEIFELWIGAAFIFDHYFLDTSYDILFGVLGGALASVVAYRQYHSIRSSTQ